MPGIHRAAPASFIVSLAIGLTAALVGCSQQPPGPRPSLSPQEVVKIQLSALQHNDKPEPDHGIEVAYRFASPANKSHTGPLSQFAAMVHNIYQDMLNWKKAAYAPVVAHGNRALQRVVLLTAQGNRVEFDFVLSRQTRPPEKDCWLTESVRRSPATPPASQDTALKRHAI